MKAEKSLILKGIVTSPLSNLKNYSNPNKHKLNVDS